MVQKKTASKKNCKSKPILIQGNQAIAEGAIAAGCRFFAGYPITPATEIAEIMAARLPKVGGSFIQMEDEIASMGAVVGASLAGVKSMTATSGPGFSLKQEIIGFACITEVPCVIVNVMRGGPSTGLPTSPSQGDVMQARWGTHGDHPIIVLAASSVEDCFEITITAFNLSEKFRTPVILLSDEVVSHTREKFILSDDKKPTIINRIKPTVPPEWYIPYENTVRGVPPMPAFGEGYRYHVTGLVHDEQGFPSTQKNEIKAFYERLHRKISQYYREIQIVKKFYTDDADIVVIAYGSVTRAGLQAIKTARQNDIKAGLLQLITLFPFPRDEVEKILKKSRAVIVPELNFGQISREVKRVNKDYTRVVKINRYDGDVITPDEILSKIREVL